MKPKKFSLFFFFLCSYLSSANIRRTPSELWAGSSPVFAPLTTALSAASGATWRTYPDSSTRPSWPRPPSTTAPASNHFCEYLVMERQALTTNPVQPKPLLRAGPAATEAAVAGTGRKRCLAQITHTWIMPLVY